MSNYSEEVSWVRMRQHPGWDLIEYLAEVRKLHADESFFSRMISKLSRFTETNAQAPAGHHLAAFELNAVECDALAGLLITVEGLLDPKQVHQY